MRDLKQSNGDDYPKAAHKHLLDACVLFDGERYDGAGYLAGYVIECSLKTLLQVGNTMRMGHDIQLLSRHVADLASGGSPTTARYIPNPPHSIAYGTPPQGWKETMRYRAVGDLDRIAANDWLQEAMRVFNTVVEQMQRDGVITR